jgi:hypothetical protein
MKRYFIKDGQKEIGPFTKEQLKSQTIEKETLIWHAAFRKWTPASDVIELKEIFEKRNSVFSNAKTKFGKILGSNMRKNQFKKVS